eukprot:2507898-Pleurochrysis_carterae.AAC.6
METCQAFVKQLKVERAPASVNSLYNWARKSLDLLAQAGALPAAAPAATADDTTKQVGGGELACAGAHSNCNMDAMLPVGGPKAATPVARNGRRSGRYDPYNDPDLELPMDLKSWDPQKLNKTFTALKFICTAGYALRHYAQAGGARSRCSSKQKVEAIKALLHATKKRRLCDSHSEGDVALETAKRACDVDVDVDNSSVSEIPLEPRGLQRPRREPSGGLRGGGGAGAGRAIALAMLPLLIPLQKTSRKAWRIGGTLLVEGVRWNRGGGVRARWRCR